MSTTTTSTQQKSVVKVSFYKTVCFIFVFDGKGNVALLLDHSTKFRRKVAKPLSFKSNNLDIQFPIILDKTVKRHFRYDFDTTGIKPGKPFIKDNIQFVPYRIQLNESSNTAIKSDVTFVSRMLLGGDTIKVKGVEYLISPAVKQAATLC
jgi:hypothetical protein